MSKVFLSHSSLDKDFVEKVYSELGAAKCVYDAKTFAKNSDITKQIQEGLEDCDIYAIFLSAASIKSNWVSAELDLANELRAKWKIKKFFVFQLDETRWDTLPPWMGRYLVSCPPSPRHVTLRLLDEFKNTDEPIIECYGRGEEERQLVDEISSKQISPSFIYMSGPIGIGRRTLASSVYRSFYPHISEYKIEIPVDQADGMFDIYRRALRFSANWRAHDYLQELERYIQLSHPDQLQQLAKLLKEISTTFNQVVILNIGTSALTEEGKPQTWFDALIKHLEPADYPYLWIISQRFLDGNDLKNGVFISVNPLDEKWSTHLFRILLKKYRISLPSREEQSIIENSISGHPGLISMVVNYLKQNPAYKPNKTHNNIIKLINEQVQRILYDFIGADLQKEKAVALYSEAYILSYVDIQDISKLWPQFEDITSELMDAGLLTRVDSDYTLVSYIQRAGEGLASRHKVELAPLLRILLKDIDALEGDSYVSIQLLDARIVAHITDDGPIDGFLSKLVMPSQQIKAARRFYDSKKYELALQYAKQAYAQGDKLSDSGRREAWRLLGLSSVGAKKNDQFEIFIAEYPNIIQAPQTEAIYYFGKGFRARKNGNLREALNWYSKINQKKYADTHVYRELAYVYAFERSFEKAQACIAKAHDLAFGNPYTLDIWAKLLLDRIKLEPKPAFIQELDTCLEHLKIADERDGTHFYNTRSKMKDVIVNNSLGSLAELFKMRRNLPTPAKLALLSMLSNKGKDSQFIELHSELTISLNKTDNPLARIELARIDIEHHCEHKQPESAIPILNQYRTRFTEKCCTELERSISFSRLALED